MKNLIKLSINLVIILILNQFQIANANSNVNNLEEVIRFNPKTESATLLQGKKIKYALEEISTFLETALDNISIPK